MSYSKSEVYYPIEIDGYKTKLHIILKNKIPSMYHFAYKIGRKWIEIDIRQTQGWNIINTEVKNMFEFHAGTYQVLPCASIIINLA